MPTHDGISKNPNCLTKEVEKMAKFLDLSVSAELCAAIAKKCEFYNMVKDKVGLEDEFWTHAWRDSKPRFYRKG